jgi:alginate O-acetyltransferase complex protein AlgI
MVFSSLLFLFRFLPAVLAAYYILPKKCRNLVLFISSLVFYAWGEPVYVMLVLFSTVTD